VVDTRNVVAAALGPEAGDRPRIWKA